MTTRRLLLGVVVWALVAHARTSSAAAQSPESPAASGPVVFVGSSIFHRWTGLSQQMAPLPIVNLAFDGSQTADMLRMLDPQVLPRRPKVIVYYCGSNDVDAGEPADAIVRRIRQFVDGAVKSIPGVRVIFVSINRAPEKRDRWDIVDAVNRQVAEYAAAMAGAQYVDVNPVLFNSDGEPRFELYVADQLHLRPAAYEEFARVLKPILTGAFESQ